MAVVTGGAHGIGRAIAEDFRAEGAIVHIIDLQPGDWFVGDVGDKDTLEQFACYVAEKSGHVNYLINNALPLMKGIHECSFEDFQYALSVGVTAPFYLTKLLMPYFAPGASVINISSSRDRMSQPQTESYTAAKGGISALTHRVQYKETDCVKCKEIEAVFHEFRQKREPVPRLLRYRLMVVSVLYTRRLLSKELTKKGERIALKQIEITLEWASSCTLSAPSAKFVGGVCF